ncbi:hypothetical protein [Mycobacterium sp. HM-7]
MSADLTERTKAALEGVTKGPWRHCTAPSNDSDETHAEWLAGTLIGQGEELHVLIAESPDPKFAYIVPAVTGDGPSSSRNAEFIAGARQLVPELLAEVVKLRARIEIIRCLSSANANAFHVIGDVCREKAWLDILAVIEQESPRG